ncbi:MAG: HNH endonuclease [Enhydrobacter sp.]|nr:HNH endonuclease [Enhydrobacter sp.]
MSDSFYRTARWKALSAAVIKRDPVCATPGCGRPSTRADHRQPRALGGPDTMENLRGTCESCHNRRSARGNAPLQAIGCHLDGTPRDPGHAWLTGETPGAGSKLSPGEKRPRGARISTKFPKRQ